MVGMLRGLRNATEAEVVRMTNDRERLFVVQNRCTIPEGLHSCESNDTLILTAMFEAWKAVDMRDARPDIFLG